MNLTYIAKNCSRTRVQVVQLLSITYLILLLFQLIASSAVLGEPTYFELLGYEYASLAGTREVYPGSRSVALTIYTRYVGPATIYVSGGCIGLPNGFTTSRGWSSCSPPILPNGTVHGLVEPGDIVLFEYRIDIDSGVAPGMYELNLTIYYRAATSQEHSYVRIAGLVIKVSEYPPLTLEVTDTRWIPAAYPGSEAIYLYMYLKNTGSSEIVQASGVAKLDPQVFTPSEIDFQLANLEVNATATVTLGPLSVSLKADPRTRYEVLVELNATMRTSDGVVYTTSGVFKAYLSVHEPPTPFIDILDYGLDVTKPASNLALSRLYLTLVNRDFRTIRLITATVELLTPSARFANNTSVDVVVFQGILQYGSSVTLVTSPLVIEGTNKLEFRVSFTIFGDENGAEFWAEVSRELMVWIQAPIVNLAVIKAYWTSTTVYAATQGLTLNVVILNKDVVSVRDAIAILDLPSCFYPRRIVLSGIVVQAGDLVTLPFTGISVNSTTGCDKALLTIKGIATDATGAYFEFQNTYELTINVEPHLTGQGLKPIDAYWFNRWPVYPGTENATLVVVIANKWPYQVVGLEFELLLPRGFYTKQGSRVLEYMPGPVNPYQELMVNFEITVGGMVKPGDYKALLIARYTVMASPSLSIEEVFELPLLVNNPSTVANVVKVRWVGKAPEPPEYGAVLQVVVRNNAVPIMRGLVLELDLPEGVVCADTNTSRASTPATSVDVTQQLQALQAHPTTLTGLLEVILQQATPVVQGVQPGDVVFFYFRLNIPASGQGLYKVRGNLSFVDHWGTTRYIPVEIDIAVLGSAKIVRLHTTLVVEVLRGLATLTIGLENTGGSPLYDVYLYVYPQAPLLIPVEAVKYVGTLQPGVIVNTTLTLVYNPLGAFAGGIQTYLRYMSVPFVLTLVYKDVHGYARFFNTTLAVLVEPFIDLVLSSAQAYIARGELVVSGMLSNYGLAVARSVVVKAVYGNATRDVLVGDLDPASQSAFRLEVESIPTGERHVKLYVYYRDEYGRLNTLVFEVPVAVLQVEETPQQPVQTAPRDYAFVTLAVGVFLAFVAFIIYRYVRAHSRRLEAGIPQG